MLLFVSTTYSINLGNCKKKVSLHLNQQIFLVTMLASITKKKYWCLHTLKHSLWIFSKSCMYFMYQNVQKSSNTNAACFQKPRLPGTKVYYYWLVILSDSVTRSIRKVGPREKHAILEDHFEQRSGHGVSSNINVLTFSCLNRSEFGPPHTHTILKIWSLRLESTQFSCVRECSNKQSQIRFIVWLIGIASTLFTNDIL